MFNTTDRVQMLKAHAMRFSREEVLAVLDLVGAAYFRRQVRFTQEDALLALIADLAEALRQLPAETRASLREVIETL